MSNQEKKEEKKKRTWKDALIILVIIGLVCVVVGNNWGEINELFNPPTAANVEISRFDDIFVLQLNDSSLNVEIWLENTGQETASNITCHIRCRDGDGRLLFNNDIDLSFLILKAGETTTGYYTVPLENSTSITHTIEVSWDSGRNNYFKTTSP